ncbi:MAG: molybdopterin-dependent oxidoreductase [Burkholderiaceae bacterium]
MTTNASSPAIRRVPAYCTQCRSRCGCIALTDGQHLLAIEPLPGHPTGERLCPKGLAAPALVHHPDRLTRPLMRTRPKTDADPGWQAVGWDEALAAIATRMAHIRDEHGPQQVAFGVTTPSGAHMADGIAWVERHPRLSKPEHDLRHRDLQLAQGFRHPLHLWPRYWCA